jgi:hypothetical protein
MDCQRERRLRALLVAGLAIIVFSSGGGSALGQDTGQEDGSKEIRAEEFIGHRPRPPIVRGRVASKKPVYRAAKGGLTVPPAGKIFAQLGVTIWRFRPSTSADKTKELVEEDGEPSSQFSLERIEEGTLLAPGQRVRLSIESLSRDGYLYVINREEYGDGSLGDARLIFPTKRTPEGANRVKAGKMIYIPGPPRYFRIKPSASPKGHVAEVLTLLVSPQPLIESSQLSDTAITVSREQVESWESKWATQPTKFEMDGGAGLTMTEKEQKASTDNAPMTRDDPTPQTIYRLAIKPDDAMVIRLPLRFSPKKVSEFHNANPRQ